MRCKSARFRLGVMAVLVMTFDIISAISVDDVNAPRLAHYQVEQQPHIEYNYIVYDLNPVEVVWWKRGTHRLRANKNKMAAVQSDAESHPAAIASTNN